VAITAQATTDLAAICGKAADSPKEGEKEVYTHLCQLQLQLLEVEEAVEQIMAERELFAEAAAEEVTAEQPTEAGAADKRKNEFIRFGKRKNEFIRFGKRKNEFIRFGKRKNEFIRFGKRKNEFIRFGRSASFDQVADGKDEIVKRKNEFIRFG